MKTLESVVEEIIKQRRYRDDDLSNADEKTINARRGRKRSAEIALDYLFFDFRDAVRSKVGVIFVAGDQSDEFVRIAQEVAGLDSINSEALYDQLTSKLDTSVIEGGRESAAYVMETAVKYLQDAAIDMGIKSMPGPVYNQKYETKIRTLPEAKQLIKRVITEQIGAELQMMFVIDHASRVFYKENVESKHFPIIVKVQDKDSLNEAIFSLSNLKNKYTVIQAGQSDVEADVSLDEINEETITETLTTIKSKLK